MDPNIEKAERYIHQARTPVGGLFSLLRSKSDKLEEKIQLFEQAANCYKMAKAYKEAGNAHKEAAKLSKASTQGTSQFNAARHYADAANMLKRENPLESIICLKEAIDIHKGAGRFSAVGKHHMDVAEIYETLGDSEHAVQHYKEAADFFDLADNKSSVMKCKLSQAELAIQSGDYETGAELYDEVGKENIKHKLLKYGAVNYLFRSVLCKMIQRDTTRLNSYLESYPSLADSRDFQLLTKLSSALNDENEEAFTLAVKEYDSISRLDPVITSMLLQIKKTINGDEEYDDLR